MLVLALALLAVWLLGLIGVYDVGGSFHLLLVGALGVLLVAFLKARDDAARGQA
jgi:hypothetical protein